MKRKIDNKLSLFYTYGYPYINKNPKNLPFVATIGIGGNLGDVKKRFKKVLNILKNSNKISIVATSPLLKNPPFGYKDQPDFYNAVILLKTSMKPKRLLNYLLKIEKRFKRVRTFKNAPRTLDLDIIFYNNSKVDEKDLKIPHPKWSERASVVIPLYLLGEMI
ncbi:2-amino-4-hydroxy-6-hydroxymethyldihydropteridine diphosphokinase [Nitrosophilus kaiyonis]|uniref:2-amino-4-hydroxy-6- hydroxymethyldihydropteridine diphosphokinase n=1 Tax=Nitrosophilus kaiyonis TaxID=2930200 RepID=UPI00249306CE|nr:2-amino-4-hydroxy-6-hydroxymethyldihydropteridine diphosphokinase [Nitrosophilus kaiyonis]